MQLKSTIDRRPTKKIRIGSSYIGGDAPITIQSMTNTDTRDVTATIQQIKKLENAGCDIVRVAVLDSEAAQAIKQIKAGISIPLVADIHFNYKLAVLSIKNGADKIRINPGNISDNIKEVVSAAKQYDVPIRIGINSGCVSKDILQKHGGVTKDALVESALEAIGIYESLDFENLVISIKSSNVMMSIDAYRALSQATSYPLHIGATEVGTVKMGTIKQTVVIGTLLSEGIGDTLRVSLTGDHVEEVVVGKQILNALDIRQEKISITSCPTCGRCQVELIDLVNEFEQALSQQKITPSRNINVAIMGCAVNGPGEAAGADIGVAGGKGEFLLFKNGVSVRKIKAQHAVSQLIEEIKLI